MKILFACALLLAAYGGICQYKNVPGIEFIKAGDRASGFVDYAKALNRTDPDFDSARYYYTNASSIFLEDGREEQYTEAVTKYAWTFAYQYQHALSASVLDSVFEQHGDFVLSADTARISFYNQWAWGCLNGSRQYDAYTLYGETIDYLDSIGLSNHFLAVNAHQQRAVSARQFGMLEAAKAEYLKVLEMSRDFPGYRAIALNSLGIVARAQGDYTLAEKYYKEVLSFQGSWQLVTNLAYLYVQMGREQRALQLLDSVLVEVDRVADGQYGGIHSAIYSNIGEAWTGLQQYQTATDAYKMSRLASIATNSALSQANDDISIARSFLKLGLRDSAVLYHNEAASIIFGQRRINPILAQRYFELQSQLSEDESQAIAALDSALFYTGYAGPDKLSQINDKIIVSEVLLKKANLLRKVAARSIAPETDRKVAAIFKSAIQLARLSYQDITTRQSRARLMASSQALIDNYLDYLTQKDLTESLYSDVFDLFEFNKSNQLILSLNDRNLAETSPILKELQDLEWRISQLEKLNRNDSLLISLGIERTKLIGSAKNESAGFNEYRLEDYLKNLDDAKSRIGRAGTLLEYFVGPENSYVFTLSSGRPSVIKLGRTDSINAIAELFQEAILDHDFQSFSKNGELLASALIPDLVRNAGQLVVIPDGFISGISFEALPVRKGENYLQTRYLVQEAKVNTHFSASLYLSEPEPKVAEMLFAGFAPLAGRDKSGQVRSLRAMEFSVSGLPFSAEEITAAGAVLEGKTLIDNEATEEAFKSSASDYGVLHIATHNISDPYNTNSSMLVFADDESSGEDGLLHMSEVQEMRIHADLVNLSACNTGLGEYVVGEGVMSLARSFVFAGAQNVVMSKWQVDDRSTADLMATFYREYSEDKEAGSALRNAKLEYLRNADEITADPYYWGAWVHVGPDQRAPVNYRGVLLIVIVLIGGVIFVRVLVKGL